MISLRLCTEGDVDKVAKVLLGSGLAKTEKSAPKLFLDELKRGDRYIIAEADGKPLGIVSWILHGETRHELAELYHIGVLPEARGTGVAGKLFQALVDDANEILGKHGRKLRKLYLLTHADNERAQGFYKKMGMVRDAVLKDHFHEGTDEYVFAKFFE